MSLLMFDENPLAAAIRSLFAAGEQGILLDPSDFSTLFQDAAGTTPVTELGQPVGLALDKRLGLALGPELVTNGDFAAGATGWTVIGNDATHIATFAGGTLRYQSDTTTPVLNVSKSNLLAANKTFLVTVVCSAWTSGSVKVAESTLGKLIVNGVGTFTARVSTAVITSLSIQSNSTNVDLTLDSVSARELPGNHAYQTTAASRPTLQQDSNGLYYLSFDGTDDGMVTPRINFTGTDKMTVWAGAKANSAAANAVLFELSTTFGAGNPGSMGVLWPRLPYAVNFGLAGTAAASRSTSASADKGLLVISCAFDISSALTVDEIKPRVNGAAPSLLTVDAGPAGTGNFGNYPLYIGRRGGTMLPFNGRIYQLIVRGAASNDGQIAAGEAWCNSKTRAY